MNYPKLSAPNNGGTMRPLTPNNGGTDKVLPVMDGYFDAPVSHPH
jgi:hypothetical protein